MDDLIAFLRDRIAEDEADARAADSTRWTPEDKGISFEFYADVFPDGEANARLVADTRANQWHIARWDPARVLAEVEAKRRILALHEVGNEPLSGRPVCCRCIEAPTGGLDWDWPCLTIRLLALAYVEHPDYREEWRP